MQLRIGFRRDGQAVMDFKLGKAYLGHSMSTVRNMPPAIVHWECAETDRRSEPLSVTACRVSRRAKVGD